MGRLKMASCRMQHLQPVQILWVWICLIVAMCAGCGSGANVGQVEGTVTLDDKPLAQGAILTLPEAGRGARAAIVNGKFELGTFAENDGAVLGAHRVAVVAEEPPKGLGPEAKPGKLLVPARYTDPASSGLSINVQRGENVVELKLYTKEKK